MSTFFCSDHHFFHGRILEFCSDSRPFETVEEMNEVIIDRHNSTVCPDDKVFFLGDVVMAGIKNLPIVERMNGKKILILGNHDVVRKQHRFEEYAKHFKEIYSYHDLRTREASMLLTHYPVHPQQLESGRYQLIIHGHTHDVVIPDRRYYNVCLDANCLYPTSYDDIMTRLKEVK